MEAKKNSLPANVLAILCALLILVAAGCESEPDEVPEYDGAMLFQGYCASCHGPTGQGDGPVAAKFDMKMQDLRTIQARNNGVFERGSIETIIEGGSLRLVHGTPDMPVWGWAFYAAEQRMGEKQPTIFATARIQALTDYLESIQTN